MSPVSPTNQDLSNDTTFSQIKSRVPVPLRAIGTYGFKFVHKNIEYRYLYTIIFKKCLPTDETNIYIVT